MHEPFEVRPETRADIAAIHTVNGQAFEQPDEADLVDLLRESDDVVASLVAATPKGVIGHILFSRLPIQCADHAVAAAALAPVAVRPEWQRLGVGSALIRTGLAHCQASGIEAVVVLGHPDYYPRFGFSAGFAEDLDAPFSGPAFMALELKPGVLSHGGRVRYAAAFFR